MNILLVEPNYRSTFPPLGLLRISSFFKSIGVTPQFVRGLNKEAQNKRWDKIYISSLFTFELPRTVKTVRFYRTAVESPSTDIIVGGVGATLMPEYLSINAECKVLAGPLCNPNMLGFDEPPIASFAPDYDLLKTIEKRYVPEDAYFTRVTVGCIRKCAFCAVPVLEPKFEYLQSLQDQISAVDVSSGKRHDLVILDNNILALENVEEVLEGIRDLGFEKGSKLNGRRRFVDFNQGIDVRLLTPKIAKLLGEIAINPVRIAFDHISIEKKYRKGVKLLADHGLNRIMTYVMFNFNDNPQEFYRRLQINIELGQAFDIKITGFPMRYCPISDIDRHYVSPNWNWRYLRGIQCVLNATHGIVSPNPKFFDISFGSNYDNFIKIISMPDNYIIYRTKYAKAAAEWEKQFSSLDNSQKENLYKVLEVSHKNKELRHSVDPMIEEMLCYY